MSLTGSLGKTKEPLYIYILYILYPLNRLEHLSEHPYLETNKDLFKRISLDSVDSLGEVIRVGLHAYPLLLEPEALLSSESS